MSEVQGQEFTFGRKVAVDPSLPELAPDLCRSYQWPFHLRMHRDRWEFVGGRWRPVIERVHLRPGVGGVGGKPNDFNSMTDINTMQQWARVGDGLWLIVPSGDPRIHNTCNESGNFLRRVNVRSGGRAGVVLIGHWERVTEAGKIETDENELTAFALMIMEKLTKIKEPTPTARSNAIGKTKRLLDLLQASAGSSKMPGGSLQLRRRIARVADLLAGMTGEPVENFIGDDEPIEKRPAKRKAPPAAPPSDPVEAIRALLANLSPEQRAALLAPPEVKS